jgi:EAL domain-containing protein (putative c-di-GMP-specific phosphodiesterase class I)
VFPDSFIPLAEADPGLIDQLTFSLPARLAEDLPLLDACGFEGRVALNISAQNLRRLDFPERFDEALRQHGLKPDRVRLEVTETAAMSDPLVQIDVLLRLSLKGFELSIDDFGTGYSSLSMLRRLPYSELKIDRSFVRNICTSHDSLAIVKAVLALAQSMALDTVAEGVEDDGILASITALGATRVQGFGIGRPMPADQIASWVRARAETGGVATRQAQFVGTDAEPWC